MKSQARHVTIKHGQKSKKFLVDKVEDWGKVAKALALIIKPGSIITLQGPLGAGKTTLVQYLAKVLGAPKRAISPTFALMRIYKTRQTGLRRLLHIDAYRIEDAKDLIVLDLDEELAVPGTVLLIEWPENIKQWLKGRKTIKVKIDF
ncbi:MAG: tRNA (adenosine(37)-N6)-threonylcarbamoyltransferase complex ATPase subunit type 1 TsaE [Patescibacteria group bacterium]|nr:tRNA (adenosine(37)-N6)-threonylcarbamoyltransferase complex ATPase subunit type 1 TsaE [Patescibacteria group bacterium]